MIRQFLNPPNWFTAASIFCSVYAISLLIGQPEVTTDVLARAAMLVCFGGVFDLLDGRVARLTNRSSEFGVQLDSLADVVSFGVAPAMLAWAWKLGELGIVGAFIAFWFVLCASFRLARFNADAAVGTRNGDEWAHSGHSRGLTTTMAGGSLVTMVWVSCGYMQDVFAGVPAVAVAVVVATLATLMVSSVPFRSFRDARSNRNARTILAIALASCLLGAVFLDPSMWFGVGAFLYLTWGLLDGLTVALLHRIRGRDDLSVLVTEEYRRP